MITSSCLYHYSSCLCSTFLTRRLTLDFQPEWSYSSNTGLQISVLQNSQSNSSAVCKQLFLTATGKAVMEWVCLVRRRPLVWIPILDLQAWRAWGICRGELTSAYFTRPKKICWIFSFLFSKLVWKTMNSAYVWHRSP